MACNLPTNSAEEPERYVISHLRSAFSLLEIARRLGRHHSTISREIRRNGPKYPGGVYWYYFIDPVVEKRRHQARNHRRQNHLVQGTGPGFAFKSK